MEERSKRPVTKQSRNKRREELIQSYRSAAQKNFKVKKENFDNDLIISKLKKYMYN
ncbi:hypothetical protein [Oceanobacillus salinisoli]|uniref:hypothetical protein n=1 Tax=Oceanobacillus salinisoli TaxID=2678611 RepID=UPI0012E30517|nr:hypothetical protein [Oceanobacillus salinisoli]